MRPSKVLIIGSVIICVADSLCISGVNSINVNVPTKKVTVTGDVKPEACLKAMAKIRKRASLWADTEGGGKEGKKNKNKKDGSKAQN